MRVLSDETGDGTSQSRGLVGVATSCSAAPPSAGCRQRPEVPPRCDANTISRPFGVHSLYRSSAGSEVNRVNRLPARSQIQTSSCRPSNTVTATRNPSGDTLQTDSQKYLDLRMIPTPPYFAPYEQPNPFFGTGNAFAPPRRLLIGVAAQF